MPLKLFFWVCSSSLFHDLPFLFFCSWGLLPPFLLRRRGLGSREPTQCMGLVLSFLDWVIGTETLPRGLFGSDLGVP